MIAERWLPVVDWSYEVSELGQVRRSETGYILRPYIDKQSRYRRVNLVGGKFRRRKFCVHTLVCTAFNGPRPSRKHQVAHWDGMRTNDHYSNLRWATAKENAEDRDRHGTTIGARGELSGHAKLTVDQVIIIRLRAAAGESYGRISSDFPVSRGTIAKIVWRIRWAHVP